MLVFFVVKLESQLALCLRTLLGDETLLATTVLGRPAFC